MYLPPATPSEARAVYAALRISSAAVRLERTYDGLYFSSVFLHLAVRLGFLFLGLSMRLRDLAVRICTLAGRWPQHLWRSAFVYYLLYSSAFTLFWSPLAYHEQYVLPHRYGLSHEGIGQWVTDTVKDASVDTLIGAVVAAFVVWGIAAYPKRWPVVFAFWSAPLIAACIFLNPAFDRIDNHFASLPQSSPLYDPLHRLLNRAGVPQAKILVADMSKRTDETNAYVTGLGASAQVVLWDTLIKRMPTDEVVAITAHELGHYVEHHVLIGGALGAVAMFAAVPLLKFLSDLQLHWFGSRWKVGSLADPAALPVLLISYSVIVFAGTPVYNAVSRMIEHRADSYGLALTQDRLAMARAQVDLANENLTDPFPPKWEIFWLEDHPPSSSRIHFALYGQPLNLQ